MTNRIVHLGVGNFFRAHQAWYTHRANALAGSDWRVTGVSLRRPDMRDALSPQEYAYTLAVRGAGGTAFERIAVIDDILVLPEDPEAVLAALADPGVEVITLTVTEKGYDLDARGLLMLHAPAIAADLAGGQPSTVVGLLARGLARRAASGAPITILSCDNLPGNGGLLATAVATFADAAGLEVPGLRDDTVTFPSSMVDRITPATGPALAAEVAAAGFPSAGPVETESFTEWVIEDRFAAGRPAWERAGAALTDDVEPYETRKLRLLNGAHSCLAYAGTLAGYAFVHEAVADPDLSALIGSLMEEAAATLPAASRAAVPAYARALRDRFANPALRHRLRQIAADGSLKLPIRILSTRAARRAIGLDSPACDATLIAWARFLRADIAAGRAIDDRHGASLTERLARDAREDALAVALDLLGSTEKNGRTRGERG